MTGAYCLLALAIAFSLSHANRAIRASGTLLVALSLAMIITSIVLADFDGTFASFAATAAGFQRFKPLILNIEAGFATLVTLFLVWAAWRQARRLSVVRLLPSNTESTFGFIARYAHWITAVLIMCLIPMGIFMSLLPAGSPDREAYRSAHEALGLVVLGVVALRMGWLIVSPPPRPSAGLKGWEIRVAGAVHVGLYAMLVALPVSGLLLEASRAQRPILFGWAIPPLPTRFHASLDWSQAHDWVVPGVLLALLGVHIGAVVKHHFFGNGNRPESVPRMLR